VSEYPIVNLVRSNFIGSLRYDDPNASSVMAHRQHKKPKLEVAKIKQNDPTDTSFFILEASDVDLITDSKPLDPTLPGGEWTANP
jgi:hypothetical protein